MVESFVSDVFWRAAQRKPAVGMIVSHGGEPKHCGLTPNAPNLRTEDHWLFRGFVLLVVRFLHGPGAPHHLAHARITSLPTFAELRASHTRFPSSHSSGAYLAICPLSCPDLPHLPCLLRPRWNGLHYPPVPPPRHHNQIITIAHSLIFPHREPRFIGS